MRAWRRDTLALDSTTSQSTFLPRTISGFSIESRLGARESGSLSRTIIVSPHRTRSSRDAGAQSLQCVVVELRALAGELHDAEDRAAQRLDYGCAKADVVARPLGEAPRTEQLLGELIGRGRRVDHAGQKGLAHAPELRLAGIDVALRRIVAEVDQLHVQLAAARERARHEHQHVSLPGVGRIELGHDSALDPYLDAGRRGGLEMETETLGFDGHLERHAREMALVPPGQPAEARVVVDACRLGG